MKNKGAKSEFDIVSKMKVPQALIHRDYYVTQSSCDIKMFTLPIGQAPIISAKINGKKAVLLIDTGAAATILLPSCREKFKLIKSGLFKGQPATTASGTLEMSFTTARRFQIGGAILKNEAIGLVDVSHLIRQYSDAFGITIDGVLGLLQMIKLRAVINLQTGTITLQHPGPAPKFSKPKVKRKPR